MADDTLYTESAYYRMLFRERTQDLPLYLRLTEGVEGEVLELGVGDGRVAAALAGRGRRVVGVDDSPEMLRALEERMAAHDPGVAARVRAVRGDGRTIRLNERFERVLCPFNGLAHYRDASSLTALFGTVRAHLAPGGLFAFDVMIPDPGLLAGGASSVPYLVHPRTQKVCRMEETYAYDSMRQVLTVTTHLVERESERRQELTLSLRQLFPEETRLLLEHHGFEVLERIDALGDSLAYVCRPEAS